MIKLASKLLKALEEFKPSLSVAGSGSIYIKLEGSKVKQIRVANHHGRKTGKNSWELRSDAVTGRYKTGRIYNVNSINQLIKDVK